LAAYPQRCRGVRSTASPPDRTTLGNYQDAADQVDPTLIGGAVRLILHRIFGRHTVSYYTDNARYTRGVCWCGIEGDLNAYGEFI
jgi:hypothetical protein